MYRGSFLTAVSFAILFAVCDSFKTTPFASGVSTKLALLPSAATYVPPSLTLVSESTKSIALTSNLNGSFMNKNIQDWASQGSSIESSSTSVSVQEYKKPTQEEIEAKKRNFNFWFWGGGFVAPFLATFYYFGFKFWEK